MIQLFFSSRQETVSCDDVREPVFELAIQQQQRTFPEITSCSYCKATPSETKIKRCTKCLRNGYCNQLVFSSFVFINTSIMVSLCSENARNLTGLNTGRCVRNPPIWSATLSSFQSPNPGPPALMLKTYYGNRPGILLLSHNSLTFCSLLDSMLITLCMCFRQWMNIQFYENGVAINPPRSLGKGTYCLKSR